MTADRPGTCYLLAFVSGLRTVCTMLPVGMRSLARWFYYNKKGVITFEKTRHNLAKDLLMVEHSL